MKRATQSVGKLFDGRAVFVAVAMLAAACSTSQSHAYDRERAARAIKSMTAANTREELTGASRSNTPVAEQALREGAASHGAAFWTFTFDYDNASIRSADATKVNEISEYVRQDPALRVGIDGSTSPRGLDPHNQGLRERRIEVVREALIAVGVPAYIIETAAFGKERIDRDRSVEVLVRTGQSSE